MSRNSYAYIDIVKDGVVTYNNVGRFDIRISNRMDENGAIISGLLLEGEKTNYFKQSTNINDGVEWYFERCSVSTAPINGPINNIFAGIIHEDDTAADDHWIRNIIDTSVSVDTQYVYSVILKKINRSYSLIQLYQSENLIIKLYINLENGNIGTTDISVSGGSSSFVDGEYGSIDLGDGWYRAWFTFNTANVSGELRAFIYPIEEDGVMDFDGLDQDSIYVAHAQFEAGDFPTSPITTTLSIVTRNSDDAVKWTIPTNNKQELSISFDCLVPNAKIFTSLYPFQINKDFNNRILFQINNANALVVVYNGGEIIAQTASGQENPNSNEIRRYGIRINNSKVELIGYNYKTGTMRITSDVSLTDEIPIGLYSIEIYQYNRPIISNFRYFDYFESNNNRLLFYK